MSTLIGNQRAQDYLFARSRAQQLAHAYLLAGPAGVGKATLADRLVLELHGLTAISELATDPDYQLVARRDDKKDITIEQVREITEFLKLASWAGRVRVVVIDQAENLNLPASNALLKTLEEPLGRALLILISSQPQQLLPTIRSRCQEISLAPVPVVELKPWLKAQGARETQLPELLSLSQGRPGQALYWLNQPAKLKARREQAVMFLSFLQSQRVVPVISWLQKRLLSKKSNSRGATGVDNTHQGQEILNLWLEITRDLILCKYGLSSGIVYQSLLTDLTTVANHLAVTSLLELVTVIQQAVKKLQNNANVKLTLEWLLITILSIMPAE